MCSCIFRKTEIVNFCRRFLVFKSKLVSFPLPVTSDEPANLVLWTPPIESREWYKRRDLIGCWRVFERSGGKKRTRWPISEGGFYVALIWFSCSVSRRSSLWKNQSCLCLHLLELLTTSFAPHRSSPKELKEVCGLIRWTVCRSFFYFLIFCRANMFILLSSTMAFWVNAIRFIHYNLFL